MTKFNILKVFKIFQNSTYSSCMRIQLFGLCLCLDFRKFVSKDTQNYRSNFILSLNFQLTLCQPTSSFAFALPILSLSHSGRERASIVAGRDEPTTYVKLVN